MKAAKKLRSLLSRIRKTRLPLVELIALAALAGAFTAAILWYSTTHSRLLIPATSDNDSYMNHVAQSLRYGAVLGFFPLVKHLFFIPPPSPVSWLLITPAFLVFGLKDWAAHLANGVLVFVFLAFLNFRVLRTVPGTIRYLALAYVLTIPMTAMIVHEVRPDFAAGLFNALAIYLLLAPEPRKRDWQTLTLSGICVGLSLLTKSSAVPATLLLYAATLMLAWFSRTDKGTTAGRHFGVPLTATLAVAGPYYAIRGTKILAYLGAATMGPYAHLWKPDLTVAEQWLYFLTGESGSLMLGVHIYLLAGVVVLGAAAAHFSKKPEGWRTWLGLLVIAAVAYAIPSLSPSKNPYVAQTFQVLLVFLAAFGLRFICRVRHGRVIAGIVLAASITAGAISWYPLQTYGLPFSTPDDPTIKLHQQIPVSLIDRIATDCGERCLTPKGTWPVVFITTNGIAHIGRMRWLAFTKHLFIRIEDITFFVDVPNPPDALQYSLERIGKADYLIASESDSVHVVATMPSGAVADQLLSTIKKNSAFKELSRYPDGRGRFYYLFKRITSTGAAAVSNQSSAPARPAR